MKKKISWLLVGLLLVSFLVGAGPAAAQEPVTLEVYDPTGAREITVLHAPRLDTLADKTICEVTNQGWQAHRTFPLLRELLQRMYPTATIIPYTEFPQGTGDIQTEKLVDAVKAAKCDAVITGNAG